MRRSKDELWSSAHNKLMQDLPLDSEEKAWLFVTIDSVDRLRIENALIWGAVILLAIIEIWKG